MGAPGIAAVIIRREKDLVAHFQRAGAIDRASAMTPTAVAPTSDTAIQSKVLTTRCMFDRRL